MYGRTVFDNMQEGSNHQNIGLSTPGMSFEDHIMGVGGSRYKSFSFGTSLLNMAAGSGNTLGVNVASGYNANLLVGQLSQAPLNFAASKVYGTKYGSMGIDIAKNASDSILNRMGMALEWNKTGDGFGRLSGLNLNFDKSYRSKHLEKVAIKKAQGSLKSGITTKAAGFIGDSLGYGAKSGLIGKAGSIGMKGLIGAGIAHGVGSMFDVAEEDMSSVRAIGAGIGVASELAVMSGRGIATAGASVAKNLIPSGIAGATISSGSSNVVSTIAKSTLGSKIAGIAGNKTAKSVVKGLAGVASGALKATNFVSMIDGIVDMASIGNEIRMDQQVQRIKDFPSEQMAMIHNTTNSQNVSRHTQYSMSNEMELNYLLSSPNMGKESYNNYING